MSSNLKLQDLTLLRLWGRMLNTQGTKQAFLTSPQLGLRDFKGKFAWPDLVGNRGVLSDAEKGKKIKI